MPLQGETVFAGFDDNDEETAGRSANSQDGIANMRNYYSLLNSYQ